MIEKELFAQDYNSLVEGSGLNESDVHLLERQVLDDPNNVQIRLRLLGYYCRNNDNHMFDHILWLIENGADRIAWRHNMLICFNKDVDALQIGKAKQAWNRKLDQCPDNPEIIGNAGMFLIDHDFEIGVRLLCRAMELNPKDDFWAEQVSGYCFRRARNTCGSQRIECAKLALTAGKQFLEVWGCAGGRGNSGLRERTLELCALCAFWAGDFDTAQHFATEHLTITEDWSVLPHSSRAILGLIALEEGDLESAKKQLLFLKKKSRVDSIDFELANRIMAAGESGTVLQYLKKCKKLGHWQDRNLDGWISALIDNQSVTLF